MRITLSHSGKQHSYHVARSLKRLGFLDKFYTSSYVASPLLQDYFTKSGNTYFSRRYLPGLGGADVDANWRFELREVLIRKFQGKSKAAQEAVYNRDETFDSYVAGQLRSRKSDAFWGFQGSCLQSLRSAKSLGKNAIVELATAHVTASKQILGDEALLHPEWADSLDNLVFPAAYEKRLREEPHLADIVVSASDFTTQTLISDGIAPEKIHKISLGFDMDYVPFAVPDKPLSQRPLRLLYAGTVTQRKGIKYLLEAMKLLKNERIDLTVVGGIQGSGKAFKTYEGLYNYLTPVSQLELFQMYGQYDALVLPTVFEGFGLVIVEAMAAGLPVITTAHSMGPDLIKQGENGWVIPIRQVEPLVNTIAQLREMDDDAYIAMRQQARTSVEAFSWNAYFNNLEQFVRKTLISSWCC